MNPLKIGNGKELFKCLETCFARVDAANGDECFCGVFYMYNN